MRWHGLRLGVDIEPEQATYTLRDGGDADARLAFRHNDKDVTVTIGAPVTEPVRKRTPMLPRPLQPAGREPAGPTVPRARRRRRS